VVSTTGDDDHDVSVTVEYVLDDPATPVTTTFDVTTVDGERRIGWEGDGGVALFGAGTPGSMRVNDAVEYELLDEETELRLLPGLYAFEYVDPTGTTEIDPSGETRFDLAFPVSATAAAPESVSALPSSIGVTARFTADVVPGVEAEIERLQAACAAEGLAGPSCPPEIVAESRPVADPASVAWYEQPGAGVAVARGRVEYTASYRVEADDEVLVSTGVYTGTVTRSPAGVVAFTR
jgi:hypothetical protein